MDSAPLPTGFAEIAIVQVRGYGTHATLDRVIPALQAECAAMGGDLVGRVRFDQGANGAHATGVCGVEATR